MLKKIFSNQQGFTMIELMIVVVVTVIISVVTVRYIRNDDIRAELNSTSDKLMSDIRYIRNLAATRTAYDFNNTPGNTSDDVFPTNGYGIIFNSAHRYFILVDRGAPGLTSGDGLINPVDINSAITLDDYNPASTVPYPYFTFKSDKELYTNLVASAEGKYQIELDYNPAYPEDGYNSVITVGEDSDDGSILVALGRVTNSYGTIAPIVCTPNNAYGCSIPGGFCCSADYTCTNNRCVYDGLPIQIR